MKTWLEEYNREIYSKENEGKSIVAERSIRTLKNAIHKYTTSITKTVCINKIDDIVDKYNNTYHRTIKMKPVDVKWSACINFDTQKKIMIKILNSKFVIMWENQI